MKLLLPFVLAIVLMVPALAESPKAESSDSAKSSTPQIAWIRHYNRAVELHQQGFFNQALAEYHASVDLDPSHCQPWGNMGAIYVAQGKYERALEAYQKSLNLEPRNTSLNAMATCLYALGRIDEAIVMWRQTLEMDPTFPSASFNLANALDKVGKHDEAASVRRSAAQNDGRPTPESVSSGRS